MVDLTRRQAVGSIAAILGGTSVLALLTQDTSAATISGDFSIPDTEKDVTNPVNGLRLNVDGTFSWESDTQPTKAIVRVEVERGEIQEQVEAERLNIDTDGTQERSFAFDNLNLLDHSGITAADLSPTEPGETKSISLTGVLKLSLEGENGTLAKAKQEDSFNIKVERVQGETTVTLQATGEVEINTSDGE